MKALERELRDAAIMRALKEGVEPLKIARKHRLTLTRINQIIEREKCRGTRKQRSDRLRPR